MIETRPINPWEVNRTNLIYDPTTVKHRNTLEITHDLLEVLNQGEMKVTHLTHTVRLNYRTLQKYLPILLEFGLVYEREYIAKGKKRSKRKMIGITIAGSQFLDKIKEINDFFASFATDHDTEVDQ